MLHVWQETGGILPYGLILGSCRLGHRHAARDEVVMPIIMMHVNITFWYISSKSVMQKISFTMVYTLLCECAPPCAYIAHLKHMRWPFLVPCHMEQPSTELNICGGKICRYVFPSREEYHEAVIQSLSLGSDNDNHSRFTVYKKKQSLCKKSRPSCK